jgi:hypothetical protein
MGYTHYFGPKSETPVDAWNRALKIIKAAKKESGIPLCAVWDHTKPKMNRDHICFNGKGDGGYETFGVLRAPQSLSFCKTDRKPYDILVCVALLALHVECGLKVESDGSPQNWEAARTLYNKHARKPISVDEVIQMLKRT